MSGTLRQNILQIREQAMWQKIKAHPVATVIIFVAGWLLLDFGSTRYKKPENKGQQSSYYLFNNLVAHPVGTCCTQNIPKFASRNEISCLIQAMNCVNVATKCVNAL